MQKTYNLDINSSVTARQAAALFALIADFEENKDPVDCPECTTQNDPVETRFDKLMARLNGNYKLRTVEGICRKLGYANQHAIEAELEFNVIDYILKTRRSDGAALIGLYVRN